MGTVKIRYRKCDGCSHKFWTFEEIDNSSAVRGHEKRPRHPVVDAVRITCPDCKGDKVRHDHKVNDGDTVTHFYTCKGCKSKFGIEAHGSDPISDAR